MNPCIYCNAPWPDVTIDIEHDPGCPSITGLFPVLDRDLGHKVTCTACGHINRWPDGFACTACLHAFVVGECYVQRRVDNNFFAVVCLSCEATGRPLSQPV